MKKKLMVTFILVAMAVSMIPIAAYATDWDLVSTVTDPTKEQNPTGWPSIAVGPGDNVTLKVNFSNPITIPAGSKFIIEAGVTASGNIDNKGTLIIKGSATGTVDNSGFADIQGTVTTLDNTGSATIGTGANVSALNNKSGANTTMNDGTVGTVTNDGTMTVGGGTITGTVANNSTGDLTFNGGSVGGVVTNNGKVTDSVGVPITNITGAIYNSKQMCSCGALITPPPGDSPSEHLIAKCPDSTCPNCGSKMSGTHASTCTYYNFKFYYQKKDTTDWVGTDDVNVAMKQAEGGKMKLGAPITGTLTTSNYSFELVLGGNSIGNLIVSSGQVKINDNSAKIGAASGNILIYDGDFGSVSSIPNAQISGGIFDYEPPAGSYDSTKYATYKDPITNRYKVLSVTAPEIVGSTTNFKGTINAVQVVDASNTTGISITDASKAIILKDVKSVIDAFVADGSTLAVGGAVGELITSAPYSMTAANILNTLKNSSTVVNIVFRKEDLKMANAGFDYQHIKAKLTPGYSVAALYDISIICYVGNTPIMKLTRTSGDIDITLGIASALRAAGRRYEVIGVHNDNYGSYYYDQNYFFAQNMSAGTSSYHTINFKSNFFSTYALAALGGNFNVPVTADSNNTTLWVTLLCVSGMCGACAIYLRRRKAKVY